MCNNPPVIVLCIYLPLVRADSDQRLLLPECLAGADLEQQCLLRQVAVPAGLQLLGAVTWPLTHQSHQ